MIDNDRQKPDLSASVPASIGEKSIGFKISSSITRRGVLGLALPFLSACATAAKGAEKKTILLPDVHKRSLLEGSIPIANTTPRATVTPTRTSTPNPTSTPELTRTPTPDTRPAYPWPPEIVAQLNQLPVLDRGRLKLGFYTSVAEIPYSDIREMFRPPVGEVADVPRRMVQILAVDGAINGYKTGSDWLHSTWGIYNIAHSVGHFHQAEMSRREGMDPDSRPNFQQSYLNTQEGKAYVVAATEALNRARSQNIDLTAGLPWPPDGFGQQPYEDAASMIGLWYHQSYRFDNQIWAPLKNFAKQWWPQTSA